MRFRSGSPKRLAQFNIHGFDKPLCEPHDGFAGRVFSLPECRFPRQGIPMTLRSVAITSTLLCLLTSPLNAKIFPFRDRDRDRDPQERIDDLPSPPEVLEARAKADTSYQQREYSKVIELTNW